MSKYKQYFAFSNFSWILLQPRGRLYEELCCFVPTHGSFKVTVILQTFTKHFEERVIDMQKIFAVTTNDAHTIVAQQHEFFTPVQEKIGRSGAKL